MVSAAPVSTRPQRLISLDILRGITIAFMIMVNNNGGHAAWAQMHHAEWNGFTATDLVFPTFLFVVGVSIVLATEARLAKGATRTALAWRTVKRACLLLLFGFVVNNFPYFEWDEMRFYGVLQRIAICYLLVSLFYLFDKRVWTKVLLLAVVLLGYWALVQWVPVPGAGVPGRDVPFLDKDLNIVAWVDRQLMPGHLYEDSTTHNLRDPEGLLSDIPALGSALLGLLTGMALRSQREMKTKLMGLAGGAASCLAVGYTWSIWFPLNKKMWTSSYVLVTAGWSLAILALLFWLVELKGWGKGKDWTRWVAWPWLVFGSNAIAAYIVSELLPAIVNFVPFDLNGETLNALGWMRTYVCGQIPNPGWAAFSYSVLFTAICFVPVWILYEKKIFLKV
jgi:predicted acyltransferase